ncbi:hypothetical protein L9F63_008690 [Diploptera punctata]|uniref:Ionotropic glutamate receptor C-terminal domain-containing protein n=1 Tax=Diploptera punctata TaxID=6984 RepID=A0AAD8E1J9_DIPPU|nr:hypothetical protein L9F63_008690 [Diploptera punctata]
MVNYIMHKSIIFELSGFREISYNVYFIWSILTSVSVSKIPKTTRVRVFFLQLVCYVLVMSTLFQSFFTSFLTEPVMERGITTVEELIISKQRRFQTSALMELNSGGIRIQRSSTPIENFLNIENSAVLTTEIYMKLKISNRMRLEKPCSFLFLSETSQCVIFHGLSPFYEAFNLKVMRSLESGLVIKLLDDYFSSDVNINETLTTYTFRRNQQEEYFAIDLQHLRIVFFIYLFGMTVRIFVFIFEIV